ncbi:MAG: phosphatidylserine decarboxylase family protein [Deltaproteobacteria bacterium]|nr:MAG: phosphatidylserine decarboxylase family protein [Deltaproteobacteria bacterium]RLB82117.1 MAG: phosphatidylserine decarboxylase family protein [Deltaproteobacteria bacterium]
MTTQPTYSNPRRSIPVAKEGLPFIAIGLGLTVLAALIGSEVGVVLLGLITLFVVYFFRDPDRPLSQEPNAIVAPADGKLLKVQALSPSESPLGMETFKISIFMSLFNVHVNRSPAEGIVENIVYEPGKFFSANLDKASDQNEKNRIFIETSQLGKIMLVQIAGLIARRIVCWVQPGERLHRGQRLGLIRFGSRVEIYVPATCRIVAKQGQRVKAGQTIIGYSR